MRDASGAVAVEFAMVVLPLIFMLLSIIELALVFMVSATLESSTNAASRQIRTGAAQGASVTKQQFRNAVCAKLGWLQTECASNLTVDVRVFSTFGGQNPPSVSSMQTNGKIDDSKTVFNMGTDRDIVLVRCYYRWKLISPFLAFSGLPSDDGGRLISATTTFRNEPYS